jgi:hypothetical protein
MQILDVETGKMIEVIDKTAEAATITDANPVPEVVKQDFLRHREAHLSRGLFAKIRAFFSLFFGAPCVVPNTVALGTYFGKQLRDDGFDSEATIYWYVVVSQKLGGTSQKTVFITSTNMASHGTETLISYQGGGDAALEVWESNGTPVRSIPWSSQFFQDHLMTHNINGHDYPVLYIVNRTYGEKGLWNNQVLIYDPRNVRFDEIWNSAYPWDPSRADRNCWAPIIETPDNGQFGTTNIVGYEKATLLVGLRGSTNAFRLDSSNSDFVGTPASQFDVVYLDPNHTLLAN